MRRRKRRGEDGEKRGSGKPQLAWLPGWFLIISGLGRLLLTPQSRNEKGVARRKGSQSSVPQFTA